MASAVLLIATMIVVGVLYHHQATGNLVEMVERQNIMIDRMVSKQVWTRHEEYFKAAATEDGDALRAHRELTDLQQAIAAEIADLPVLKVKIYSPAGLVTFSSDIGEIGVDAAGNVGVRAAVADGLTSSKLSYEDRMSVFSRELFDRAVVETYLPIRDAEDRIVGVFEVYTDVTDVKAQIDRTTLHLGLGLAVIFSVLYAVLVFGVLRRAIAPIRLASRRAASIGPSRSRVRLPTRGMPREIMPLLEATNGALDRLDQALDAQRRFTADAAHELLTPLAILRAQVDSAEHEAAGVLHRDIDAITEIVRQLLLLSELDSLEDTVAADASCDVHQVVVDVVALLVPLAHDADKEISVTGTSGPVIVRGTADVLSGAIRNLVENAIRHTPPGSTVTVDIRADGRLSVTDRGPGVPAANRELIFQRFWRGNDSDGGGAGLGLSIVRRIVEVVGGSISVEDAKDGGARFIVHLVPVNPAPSEAGRSED